MFTLLTVTGCEIGRWAFAGRSSVGLPELETESDVLDRGVSLLVRPFAIVRRFPVVRRRFGVSHDISLGTEGMFECVCENLYI